MTRKGFRQPIAERMERFTDKSGGPDACWPWTGGKTGKDSKHDYGAITIEKRLTTAHRVAYELAYGPIPPGHYVLHRCDHPPCVNPAHLCCGTPAENTADMMQKGRFRLGTPNPAKGERVKGAKLTDEQALEMRRLRADGATYQELAAHFAVSYGTVEYVCSGRGWRHLPVIDAAAARQMAHERLRLQSQHRHSRLTTEDVRLIRSSPGVPLRTLAKRLGVSAQTIANVRNGTTWREVAC